MNKIVGAFVCAGLTWLGLQTSVGAQSISITIGGSNRGAYVGVPIRQRHYPHNGVVFKPGIRQYGGVVYHGGRNLRPAYRDNVVIYSNDNECCDCDRDRRVYRSAYPSGYYYRQRDTFVYPHHRENYYRSRNFGY
jgi:hypothetical protein